MAIVMPSEPQPPPRPNPRTLTTLPEILASLSALESEEADLSGSLSKLLSDREPIVNALTRVQSLVPRLDELHSEAVLLSDTVSATAKTADRVGGRVRSLDEEIRRVREAGERVGQVMELKVRDALYSSRCRSHLEYAVITCGPRRVDGIPRLGVCNTTLCSCDGTSTGRHVRPLRGELGGQYSIDMFGVHGAEC